MGKSQKFVVDLDVDKDTVGVYTAGQTISGCIQVQLSEPIEIRRIYIEIKGKAKVKWTETYGKTVVVYHAKEVFFKNVQIVIGSDKKKLTLPAGLHQYPFSYTLPADSASSFHADHGKVFYKAKATIDKPWAFDEITRRDIPVAGIVDLNEPSLFEFVSPITVDMSKDASGLLSSGTVSTRISLSRRCVVPGDTVFLSAEIHNGSNHKIKKVWASLKQYNVYHAQKVKRQSKRLTTVTREELIAPGEVGNWVNVPIVVPQLPPTNLGGRCTILIVNYALKFYTDSGLKLSFPVVVGTVPVRCLQADGFQQPYLPETQPHAAPPSYEEANQSSYSACAKDKS
jgi:hypothetical protein